MTTYEIGRLLRESYRPQHLPRRQVLLPDFRLAIQACPFIQVPLEIDQPLGEGTPVMGKICQDPVSVNRRPVGGYQGWS